MIRLLFLAIFMVIALSACSKNQDSSTEFERELSPHNGMNSRVMDPIHKVENGRGKMPNIKGDNYNKLAGYGQIIGRADACGINTEAEKRQVTNWIDQNTTSGTMDNQMWQMTFAQMITAGGNAQQREIETDPKSCDRVLLTYTEAIPWPE